jgi:hypothetical protein
MLALPMPRTPGRLTVAVTGGRDFTDELMLFDLLDRILAQCEQQGWRMGLVEGGARGADRMAREWGWHNHVEVITERAYWQREGNSAGPLRNQRIIDKHQPDVLVAMPGGPGTHDMKRRAEARGIPILESSP